MSGPSTFGEALLRIAPSDIHIPKRLGLYFPDKAAALGRLMAIHGQRTPITVRQPLLVTDQDKKGVPHGGKHAKRHPLDWYVEEGWEWEQVVDSIGLEVEILDKCAIMDPACGFGHSLSRLQGIGFTGELLAGDLVNNIVWDDFDRPERVDFKAVDFLDLRPARSAVPLSIFMNPPYSYKDGILEAFCRQALAIATHRVVVLAPLKWMSGGVNRGRFFREEFPPQQTLHFTSRPSMPPGDRIHLMKRPYRGGVIDYVAVVWDVRQPTAPGETREVWLPLVGQR